MIERKENFDETIGDEKQVKPLGTSIFDRARPPPRISRPVPLSEKSKFAYKASDGATRDSYDYEDTVISSSVATTSNTPSTPKTFSFQKSKQAIVSATAKTTTTTSAPAFEEVTEVEYVYEDEYYDTPTTPKPAIESSSIKVKEERASIYSSRVRNENLSTVAPTATTTTTTTTQAPSPDSFRLNRYKSDSSREQYVEPAAKKPSIISTPNANNKKFANKQTVFEPVTHETPVKQLNNFQTAYINRNLENKHDIESTVDIKPGLKSTVVFKRPFLPSRGGEPYKARGLQPVGILAEQQKQSDENKHDGNNRKQSETHKLTLEDLYNEEYDVDLNDALNPMLKPLTSSRNVHGYTPQNANDQQKSSQKISSKADHFVSRTSATATTTAQPEYYDDEFEYTYADDVV